MGIDGASGKGNPEYKQDPFPAPNPSAPINLTFSGDFRRFGDRLWLWSRNGFSFRI